MSIERPRLRFLTPRKRRSRIAAVGATLAAYLLSQAGLDHGGKVVWYPGEHPLIFWADADPNAKAPAWLDTIPVPVLTTVFLTSGSSWSDPGNWNDANNKVEIISRGQNGSNSSGGGLGAAGGRGGTYASRSNIALQSNGDFPVATVFGLTTSFNASHSGRNVSGTTGDGSGIGSIIHPGGNGGTGNQETGKGGGGGGAGGPDANGNDALGANGGAANGGISFQWDGSHKPGDGGNGGGNGSGGGGGGGGGANGGSGAAPIIVVTYSALNFGNGIYSGVANVNAPVRKIDVQSHASFAGISTMVAYKRPDGEGSFAGVSTLAVSAFLRERSNAQFSGNATITATTRGPWHINATLNGVASLSARSSIVFASALLSGVGTMSPDMLAKHPASAGVAGQGSVNAQALTSNENYGFLFASSSLAASSTMVRAGLKTLVGVGVVACDAWINSAKAGLVGNGGVILDAAVDALGVGALAGTSAVICNAGVLRATSALLECDCSVGADTIRLSSISSSRHGQAFMRADSRRLLSPGISTIAGHADLYAHATGTGKATLNATSSLSAKARKLIFDQAHLSAVSGLTANSYVGHRQLGAASLSGVGGLGGQALRRLKVAGRLDAAASLNAGAVKRLYPRASLHANANVVAAAVHKSYAGSGIYGAAHTSVKSCTTRIARSGIGATSTLQASAFPASFMGASLAAHGSLICDARSGSITYPARATAKDQITRSRVLLRA